MLEAFLTWHRQTLLQKCAGLDADQLVVRPFPPSELSLLGLVRHLAYVERVWLRERVAGQTLEPLYDPALGQDGDFTDLDPARAPEDFGRLAEEGRLADAAVAEIPLDQTFTLRGQEHSLRLVYLHLIEEYARHNGHADLIREQLDGVTGE